MEKGIIILLIVVAVLLFFLGCMLGYVSGLQSGKEEAFKLLSKITSPFINNSNDDNDAE